MLLAVLGVCECQPPAGAALRGCTANLGEGGPTPYALLMLVVLEADTAREKQESRSKERLSRRKKEPVKISGERKSLEKTQYLWKSERKEIWGPMKEKEMVRSKA